MSESKRALAWPAAEVGTRLSALDAACLLLDRPNQPLHMGVVVELEGRIDYEDLVEALSERLLTMPRFRQRPVRSRLDLRPPRWEDDPSFDVRHHVRHVALPAPGDADRLRHVAETLYSAPLAPDRPLWEVHLIDGLDGRRSALLCKIHHCMSDGVGALQILERIADPQGELGAAGGPSVRLVSRNGSTAGPVAGDGGAEGAPAQASEPVEPGGRRSSADTDAASGLLASLLEAAEIISDPPRLLEHARDVAEAVTTAAALADQRDRDLPFQGKLGHARRLVFRSFPLDEFTSLRTAADCTLNDAVLAILAGALRHYLDGQGVFPDDLVLRAAVPVNVRSRDNDPECGNLFTAVFPRLPVDVADPVERLRRARDEMREIKRRGQARATGLVLTLIGALPWQAEAALLDFLPDRRFVDAVCTNVPGPKRLLSFLGRRVLELHPIVPLFQRMGLNFAVATYNGRLSICATADPSLVEDADRVLTAIEESLYETRSALWERSEVLAITTRRARTPTVADLMAREIPTIGAAESMQRAHDLMRETRASHLPVVDDAFRVLGVLTQRDLLIGDEGAEAADASATDPEEALAGAQAAARAARSVLAFAAPHETAFEAGRRMIENEIDFLPVVDDGGKLLGLVTQEHFLRWSTSRMEGAAPPPVSRTS